MDCFKVVLLLLACMLSSSAYAAGIRWTDRYPFHKPAGVNVGSQSGTYQETVGQAGNAMILGKMSSTVDDVLLTFDAFRLVPRGGIPGLGLGLVKSLGPAMLLGTLVPLIWNEVTGIWEKENPNNPKNDGAAGCTQNNSCGGTPIGEIHYCMDGSACQRVCPDGPFPSPPWFGINNFFYHEPACDREGQSSNSYTSTFGRYGFAPNLEPNVAATDAEILAALTQYLQDLTNLIDFLVKLISKGLGQQVYEQSQPDHLTGPGTLTSTSSSTTTGPAGQTTTNVTNTYNITYVSNSVVVNKTVTTTVTDTNNNTSTTTTTYSPTTNPGGDTDPTPPENTTEESDLCKDHPEILACATAGTPDDPGLPEAEKPFSLTPELSYAGVCPADIELSMMGKPYVVKWTLVCDFATMLRPLVLIIAWLTAGIFVFLTVSRV